MNKWRVMTEWSSGCSSNSKVDKNRASQSTTTCFSEKHTHKKMIIHCEKSRAFFLFFTCISKNFPCKDEYKFQPLKNLQKLLCESCQNIFLNGQPPSSKVSYHPSKLVSCVKLLSPIPIANLTKLT